CCYQCKLQIDGMGRFILKKNLNNLSLPCLGEHLGNDGAGNPDLPKCSPRQGKIRLLRFLLRMNLPIPSISSFNWRKHTPSRKQLSFRVLIMPTKQNSVFWDRLRRLTYPKKWIA